MTKRYQVIDDDLIKEEPIKEDPKQPDDKSDDLSIQEFLKSECPFVDADEQFVWAVDSGNSEIVKFHIANGGVSIHLNDDYALRIAVTNMNWDLVRFLVENEANVNVENDFPIKWASVNGVIDMVLFLIDAGANPDLALEDAAMNGQTEIVNILLGAGADVNYDHSVALCWAASTGNLEMTKILVQAGSNVHTDHEYPLMESINKNFFDVATFLIQSGANLNGINPTLIKKYQEATATTVPKLIKSACLIFRVPIQENEKYYQCPNKEEHVYSKSAIDQCNNLQCFLCMKPLINTVFVNSG